MKTKLLIPLLIVLSAVQFLPASRSRSLISVVRTVRLSPAHKSGVLHLFCSRGSVTVTPASAAGRSRIIIQASTAATCPQKNSPLSIRKQNNQVYVETLPADDAVHLDIIVPPDFSLKIEKTESGPVTVRGLCGEFAVQSREGNVTLLDVSGSAVISTEEGNIRAGFRQIAPELPMAFTSFAGDIELGLPRNTRAVLKIRSNRGRITAPEMESKESAGGWVIIPLQKKGPEYRVQTVEGNIYINFFKPDM